jgi:hypothetical protein
MSGRVSQKVFSLSFFIIYRLFKAALSVIHHIKQKISVSASNEKHLVHAAWVPSPAEHNKTSGDVFPQAEKHWTALFYTGIPFILKYGKDKKLSSSLIYLKRSILIISI